jgi:hypothetical protein
MVAAPTIPHVLSNSLTWDDEITAEQPESRNDWDDQIDGTIRKQNWNRNNYNYPNNYLTIYQKIIFSCTNRRRKVNTRHNFRAR